MDLVIRNVQLGTQPQGALVDIGVENGRIAEIAPKIEVAAEAAEQFDAGGRLACGGFIETHIHLDKSRLLDLCPAEAGRVINPVRYVAPFKSKITDQDVYDRAEHTARE